MGRNNVMNDMHNNMMHARSVRSHELRKQQLLAA
jgi:hypothetical protein